MSASYSDIDMNTYLVKLNGPLNASQEETVIELFQDIAGQGIKRIVVDLADVPFIDSRGLVALVAGYKIFGRDAQNFRLVRLNNQAKLLFDLTKFDCIFQVFDTVDEAVASEIEVIWDIQPSLPVDLAV